VDLRFSPEEIAFRGEVRAFIDANLDPVTRQRMAEGRMASSKQIISWQRTLADRGWRKDATNENPAASSDARGVHLPLRVGRGQTLHFPRRTAPGIRARAAVV